MIPLWVKTFQYLPLTHAVELSRAAFATSLKPGLAWNFTVLLMVEIAAFAISITLLKRRLINEHPLRALPGRQWKTEW